MTGKQLDGILFDDDKGFFLLSDGSEVLGAMMVLVCPPSNLLLPVLQYRSKVTNKCSTPLCAACADAETQTCNHNDR